MKDNMPDRGAGNRKIHGLYTAYNKEANKTFYLLNLGVDEFKDILFVCDSIHFEYFAKPTFRTTAFGYSPLIGSECQVYAVADGEPIREISAEYDGQHKTFVF